MSRKNEELVKLRVLKLIPGDRWTTASNLSAEYEAKYHEAISNQKITHILKEMHEDALLQRRKKHKNWGFLYQYSTQEDLMSETLPLKND